MRTVWSFLYFTKKNTDFSRVTRLRKDRNKKWHTHIKHETWFVRIIYWLLSLCINPIVQDKFQVVVNSDLVVSEYLWYFRRFSGVCFWHDNAACPTSQELTIHGPSPQVQCTVCFIPWQFCVNSDHKALLTTHKIALRTATCKHKSLL